MRRALVLAALLAGALAAAGRPADAPTRTIGMPGKVYEPAKIDVLVGTTVTWKNDDAINHTATADDDAFASGYIPPGGSFSFAFTKEGRYVFHCSIHKFMRGEVNVFGLVLSGPEAPVVAGQRVVFAGLAPPGTTEVVLRGVGSGVTLRARPDGSFAARLAVAQPTVFRAVAGTLSSPRVRVVVRPRIHVAVAGGVLRATATPARPGAAAVLQRYDRERFDWVPVSRAKLDAGSSARFTVGAGAQRVRVLVRGSKGWADAASGSVVLGASSG
jgi:plastocyanin